MTATQPLVEPLVGSLAKPITQSFSLTIVDAKEIGTVSFGRKPSQKMPEIRSTMASKNAQGTNGHDNINGTNGNDNINGKDGNDNINGKGGNDVLKGSDGKDTLIGGNGKDTLMGGDDKDKLYDHSKNGDKLFGGEGRDYFYINVKEASGIPKIKDFSISEGDAIVLLPENATDVPEDFPKPNQQIFRSRVLSYDAASGKLYYDFDESGTFTSTESIAKLPKNLTASRITTYSYLEGSITFSSVGGINDFFAPFPPNSPYIQHSVESFTPTLLPDPVIGFS